MLKLFIVVIIAVAAVAYHNTDAGKNMERRIGRAIEYDNMADRGKTLLKKTYDFVTLKGMRSAATEGEVEKKSEKPRQVREESQPPQEKITDEERKALEDIIGNEE